MSSVDSIPFEPFGDEHLEGVPDLCRALSWPSGSEPRRRGIAGRLVLAAFRDSGRGWPDPVAEPGSERFHRA